MITFFLKMTMKLLNIIINRNELGLSRAKLILGRLGLTRLD